MYLILTYLIISSTVIPNSVKLLNSEKIINIFDIECRNNLTYPHCELFKNKKNLLDILIFDKILHNA